MEMRRQPKAPGARGARCEGCKRCTRRSSSARTLARREYAAEGTTEHQEVRGCARRARKSMTPLSSDSLHLSVSSVLPEDRCNPRVLMPFGPRERCSPRLGLGLDRIGPSSQQQCDQLYTAPATRPSEWRALQELIPDVRARTCIQQDGRQSHAHAMVSRDHFMQHRLSGFRCSKIGIAALENQRERCAAVRLFGFGQILVPGQRTPEHPEPARVVARPVDPLERHAHDLGTPAARAAPQDLFRDGLTRERA